MPLSDESWLDLCQRLARSKFRSRFRLGATELAYYRQKGARTIRAHGYDFIRQRLAPAHPPNDGKQTPMRGHPVFIAQHATATCCRNCLARWHRIAPGRPLSGEQIDVIVEVIMRWISAQVPTQPPRP